MSRKVPPCPNCREERHRTKTMCAVCAHRQAHWSKAYRQARIDSKHCAQCGGTRLEPHTLCRSCLDHHNERTNRLRQERQAAGLCRNCGADAGSYARCDKCREKLRLKYWFRKMSLGWQAQREAERIAASDQVWDWNGEDYELMSPIVEA